MKLTGWGLFPSADCCVTQPRDMTQIRKALEQGPLIARGNGRSYGDSAMNSNHTLDMRRLNRLLSFDPTSGQLIAEAGTTLAEIIDIFLPRGFFPLITPGTRFVTLGGMVAADVHGKNHHKVGPMRKCIDWLDVMLSDGKIIRCSSTENADLFDWTCGGMGLTGIILRVAFRLQRVESGWLRQRNFIAANLNEALDLFEQHQEASYSVAWIDCLASGDKLGRSILMLGEHAAAKDIPLSAQIFPRAHKATTIPFTAPAFALNSWSMRAFNEIFYQLKSRQTDEVLVRWDDYFYPLDKLLQWNRLYGRKGFLQFQCVLPLAQAGEGLSAILKATASAQQGSFLAVLKRLGEEGGGLSFPMAGYTLALDFPVSDKSLRLLDRLDEIVISYGGRFYLAKDARMESDSLTRSDPRSLILKELRRKNEFLRFHSLQSERLKL